MDENGGTSSNPTQYCRLEEGEVSEAPSRRPPNPRRDVIEDAVRDAAEDMVRELQYHTEQRFADLGHLMVGLVRHPPLRLDSDLDQRLEDAQTLGAVIRALAPDAPSPAPGWDAEMADLRAEVRYYQEQLTYSDALLRREVDERRKFEVLCNQASFERNQLAEKFRATREERDFLSRKMDIAVNALRQSAKMSNNLKARCSKYESSTRELRAVIKKDREGFKSGLISYTKAVERFNTFLRQQDAQRASLCGIDLPDDSSLPPVVSSLLGELDELGLRLSEVAVGSKRPHPISSASTASSSVARSKNVSVPSQTARISIPPDSSVELSDDESITAPPAKRLKRLAKVSAKPSSHTKLPPTLAATKSQVQARRTSPLGKPSVDLRAKAAAKAAKSRPDSARPEDAEVPTSPPAPPESPDDKLEGGRDLEEKAPALVDRDSPFKESVVIKPRRDGRPVRPASTVASLQSKSSVEKENAPDDFVLGLDGTSEPEVRDLTGRDAGDGFRFGKPSENFWRESLSKRFPQQQKPGKAKKPAAPPSKAPSKKRRQRKTSPPPTRKTDTSASSKKTSGRSTKTSPDDALDLLELPFTAPGARACWQKILEVRVPRPADSEVAVEYSAEGIAAFADWESSAHPYQQFLASLPADPCLFSAAEFMPDEPISIRADGLPLVVKFWRQFNGRAVGPTEKNDLGFALAPAAAGDSAAEGSEAGEGKSVRSRGGESTEQSAQGSVEEAADAHDGRVDEPQAATPRLGARAVPPAEHSSDGDFDDERAAGGSAPEAGGSEAQPRTGKPQEARLTVLAPVASNSDP
ncbi:uncharacterized protein IUM83_12461 [Phytophthora cinnamomi]|uniref:uncharacterized protein n=1 Tax=Phytophthora cinnamomi TaxID=4785 RepID=UPI003559FEDE|nr:hypothetical protein IUM83_12461 [Phytophthora cinnamomi]